MDAGRPTKRIVSAALVAVAAAAIAIPAGGPAQALVGGQEAGSTYPFIASLQLDGVHLCGTTLVAPRWVVTAGHCVDVARQLPGSLTVRVGSIDRTRGGTLTGVTTLVTHPDFGYGQEGDDGAASLTHDIGLIELDRPVAYPPIGIARQPGRADSPARTLGWGCTHDITADQPCEPSTYPARLRQLDTRLVPDASCTDLTPGVDLCTAAPRAQACAGDSGGPLIRSTPGGRRLIGVTSRPGRQTATPCPGTVVTYTDVTAHQQWISRTIRPQKALDNSEFRTATAASPFP